VNTTRQLVGRQLGRLMRGTRRSRWILVMCRAACVLLASLAAFTSGCSLSDKASPLPIPTSPTAPAPTVPTPPTAPAEPGRLQLSGRVLRQDGTPIPNARLVVEYRSVGAIPSPPTTCIAHPAFREFCHLSTTTNVRGEYSVEINPSPWPGYGYGWGYLWTGGPDVVEVQPLPPPSSSPAVQDLRVRRAPRMAAGGSAVASVDATSSLCTDLEDLYVIFTQGFRCQAVIIESGAGLLMVEARPIAEGPAPTMFWHTTGNYAGLITRPAPGTVAIPAKGGGYVVLVGIAEGGPAQQFNVTATLQ
jgi:hypothetical protein